MIVASQIGGFKLRGHFNRSFAKKVHTFKSPDILAPARIPVAAGKNMENTEKKLLPSRNDGPKFSVNTEPEKR